LLDATARPIKPPQAPDWIRDAAGQAIAQPQLYRDLEVDGRELRIHAQRFTGSTGTVYVAVAVADRVELEDQYTLLIEAFAVAALVGMLLAAGGGYVLIRKSTAPVERSMDQMRRFMADAAHELRTPITLLRTRAEVAAGQDREPTRDAATLQAIEREATRLGEITGDLLTLARADAGEWPVAREALYLDDAAAGAVEAARTLAEHKRVVMEVGTFEEAKILADPALVRRLLLIVLDNAIKFTPSGGRVRLDVSAQDGRAAVVVSDTGIASPPNSCLTCSSASTAATRPAGKPKGPGSASRSLAGSPTCTARGSTSGRNPASARGSPSVSRSPSRATAAYYSRDRRIDHCYTSQRSNS